MDKETGAPLVGPPVGYEKLPAGIRCRCFRLWTDGADYYCCKADKGPKHRHPKDGDFYVTSTLLGGDPDVNRRTIYCWPSDRPVCHFNYHMDPWTELDEARLRLVLSALNHGHAH